MIKRVPPGSIMLAVVLIFGLFVAAAGPVVVPVNLDARKVFGIGASYKF